ncbi:MAG: ABC transporter substrate-binding protein [Alphaproteobacteria bacterium]|nr:ABC transporter substrate-binding protein [Alphaproteobacteria bacterium]
MRALVLLTLLAFAAMPARAEASRPDGRWFLITAGYALGAQLEADAKTQVTAHGGIHPGSVHHPFPSHDLSSQVLAAMSSGADMIALANAGDDTRNAIKTAAKLGLPNAKQAPAALFLTATDIHSLGLAAAQGTTTPEGCCRDRDDGTRNFARRFMAVHGGMPSVIQAGPCSATLHYLKTVVASGSREPNVAIAKMRELRPDLYPRITK